MWGPIMEKTKSSYQRIIQTVALATSVSFFALSAHATVIVVGNVFPNLEVSPTGNGQISVGVGSNAGSVEVNASSTGNGHKEVSGTGLLIGNNQTGSMQIIGDGVTSGSAKAVINNGIGARVGFGGSGTLELRQGGVLQSNENIHLGEESLSGVTATTTVTVDGNGSVLRSEAKAAGFGGGRVYVPFGVANSSLTVSNGGRVEAVGGNLAEYKDGSVWIGEFGSDKATNVTVNVTGEGSTIEGQHGVYVTNEFGQAVVNITDGGAVRQLEAGYPNTEGVAIDSFDANGARVNVSGQSVGGVASSLSAVTDIKIGIERSFAGFTNSGEPRMSYDDTTIAEGVQVTDKDGNPLFDQFGNPVVGVEYEPFPGYIMLVPSTYSMVGGTPVRAKTTGHLLVENGGEVTTQGDIHISTNNVDPLVTPVSGQASSLTVRDNGSVTAQNIYINEDGILNGSDGYIFADVHLEGGTLAPGNSPGTMYIDGDLFLNSGVLELEVDSFAQDLLVVSGNVTLGEYLMINMIFSYDPMDEEFDLSSFFNAANLFSNFNPETNLLISGLGPDAYLTIVGFDGERLVFGEPGNGTPPAIPAPLSLALFGAGLAGLGLARRRT